MSLEQQVEQLLLQQSYPVIKKTEEYKKMTSEILLSLGVKEDSQFYRLYTKYFLDALDCREGTSTVVDPCPNGIMRANFAHETWGFPKHYILFTTGEGEGDYFYNTEDGTVWDAGLGEVPLLGTDRLRHWNSFYEFMIWYLTPEEEE